MQPNPPEPIDTDLDLSVPPALESPRAKLIYLYVSARDGATVEQLQVDLAIKKGTALSIASTLRKRGFLERTDDGFDICGQ
ncbi:MarR family transcriptional regulator [Natrarchaeobaculum aegyptiacum]|uniref:MarR family transcriptional regulator n=1 Tax=Natrarchaeobaculum aegyptiacum TaxID=745377 RepID=A0A2Z2HUX0_9EURY|nr:MarR family transcriptional regulator [Natrarchaeobaculum aegyptiacum]ARS88824.1 MarR family transcriptional regulator [Natrarchaeobaculum aegyptiacum]